jgi:beta-mannosidase
MTQPRLTVGLMALGLLFGMTSGAHAQSLSLSGGDWFIHAAASAHDTTPVLADPRSPEWIAARVPGNIQADLEAARLIGPLWYGAGDPRLPDVATKHWWYRKNFALPPNFRGRRLTLTFDGVDFAYEVWLNGKSLGKRKGQFVRSEFDVSDLLKVGGVNRLAVSLEPVPPSLEHCSEAADGALSGLGTPDWFVNCNIRALRTLHGLKSPANLGYDWGVDIYTLGIWRDVRIEATGPARIQWMSVRSSLSDGYRRAVVHAHLEVDSQAVVSARATFRIRGPGFDTTVVTAPQQLTARGNDIDAAVPIEKPALWWPNGQGAQPLYDIEATLTDASGHELDRRRTHFGVREIRWTQVAGVPASFPNPFQLVVNGRKIRELGSALAPPDLLFGRIGLRAPRLLYLAKAAGMNTLRLWGGDVILPPKFYDLADKLGIMLSQEFPLANATPPSDPLFLANFSESITDMVKELRNHPSIIEWSGGSEMSWRKPGDSPALLMEKTIEAANDDRIFRPTDPIDGSRHSPWTFIPQASYQVYNGVWDLRKDPTSPYTMQVMRFGEFGSQTPTSLDVFEREIPPASQWPLDDVNDPVLIRKNVLQAAFTPVDWLLKPVIEGYFGPLAGPADVIKGGQYIGADSLRYFFDELRRKGRKIGGMTSWDFDEPWPNGAGSFQVDYDGQPLMNYYFVKQALAPVSLSLHYDSNLYEPSKGLIAGLWLVSDAPAPVGGIHWRWTARDRRGNVLGQGAGTASIKPGEALKLRQLLIRPLPETALGPIVVELHAEDPHGQVLTDRVQVFGSDNAAAWPLYGLLHDTGPDPDDSAIQPHRVIRVLWVQDPLQGPYDDTAWYLRRFAVRVTYVAADDFKKAAPTTAALLHQYDAIWIGAADPTQSTPMGQRLGSVNLAHIAAAVRAGLGIGFEGGLDSFAAAGFAGTPLQDVLPVQTSSPDRVQRRGSASIVVADRASPLVAGQLTHRIPKLGGYLLLQATADAHTVLKTGLGDPLLLTRRYGKGRVLGFASGLTTNWYINNYHFTDPHVNSAWNLRAWSGFPMLVGRMLAWIGGAPDALVRAIDFPQGDPQRLTLPVRRAIVRLAHAPQFETSPAGSRMTLVLQNVGPMTALFCSPHPLLEYRPDLTLTNDFVSIPPGESRTMTIQAHTPSAGELGLSQEGWQISCWNARAVRIPPSRAVLLSFGRRDSMTREFAGPGDAVTGLTFSGSRPDSHRLPWILPVPERASPSPQTLQFDFTVSQHQAAQPSWLSINTADQSATQAAVIQIEANGRQFSYTLQRGLGEQLKDPAHLAFPETARIALPAGTWRAGRNSLEISVARGGWFTWDSLALFTH